MPFFSKVFKHKDSSSKKVNAPVANGTLPKPQQWTDAWLRTRIEPQEVAELLHLCTAELKSRALDVPFLLLPFRPASDPYAARTFIRTFFTSQNGHNQQRGSDLIRELKMTEVPVLISIMKWCWARLPGGVVTWEVYEMFKIGEKDSKYARNAFSTFIPLSVESQSRHQIITDFFDLLAAIAAHAKTNGLGGHKLSRYAGWWAFEHLESGKGFDIGYQSWLYAANATSHLFFAYLRSLSAGSGKAKGILSLPLSLQQLVDTTNYPPSESLMLNHATKIVMIVDVVSPTPHSLLRRARTFEYRDDDRALQEFANSEDPVHALTDECRRVLRLISSTNESTATISKTSTSLLDPTWSRFEDLGFDSIEETEEEHNEVFLKRNVISTSAFSSPARMKHDDLARPTTPSWADFLSSGFTDENGAKSSAPVLLPPDKMLPPVNGTPRAMTSQSYKPFSAEPHMEPGELASITTIDVDDAFWWVWISSLAGEELTARKAVFGRCAVIETVIRDGKWMVMEEQVKGAAPDPLPGAYVAEKKSFLGFTTKRGRLTRRKSQIKKNTALPSTTSPYGPSNFDPSSRVTLAPAQQARIQEAAAELTRQKQLEEEAARAPIATPKAEDDRELEKKSSMLSLGNLMKDEASAGLRWASQYDKREVRAQYLGQSVASRDSTELLTLPTNGNLKAGQMSSVSLVSKDEKDLPPPPSDDVAQSSAPKIDSPFMPNATVPAADILTTPRSPVIADTTTPMSVPLHPTSPPPPAPTLLPSPVLDNRSPSRSEQQSVITTPLLDHRSSTPESTVNGTPQDRASIVSDATTVEKPPSITNRVRRSIDGFKISPEAMRNKTKAENKNHPPPVQKNASLRRIFGVRGSKSRERTPRIAQDPPQEVTRTMSPPESEQNKRAPGSSGSPLAPVSPNRVHVVTDPNQKGPIRAFEAVVTTARSPAAVPPANRIPAPMSPPPPPPETAAIGAETVKPEEVLPVADMPAESTQSLQPAAAAAVPPTAPTREPVKRVTSPTFPMAMKTQEQLPPPAPVRIEQSRSVSAAARMLEARNAPQTFKHGAPAPIALPGKARGMVSKNLPIHPMGPPPVQTSSVSARTHGPTLPQSRINGHVQEPLKIRSPSGEATSPIPIKEPPPVQTEMQSSLEEPPVKRRDEEFNNLSRISTKEREQADREFSAFDQSSEATLPEPSPTREDFMTPSEEKPTPELQHMSIYSAVTVDSPVAKTAPVEKSVTPEMPELTPEVSAGDRWAQIRKNAAERAAKQSQEQATKVENPTKVGESDGEETIETRVARIKARVAELTGNIDPAKR